MRTLYLSLFVLMLINVSLQANNSYDFVVAADGSGNFRTVQEAINAVPDFRRKPTLIYIRNGVYKEKVIVADSKKMVTLIGESADSTILTYDDFAQKKNIYGEDKGTSGSASFYVFGSDFSAQNITFQNSSGPVGQAVALLVKGDRASFFNCRFLGFQDTLYAYGNPDGIARQYYQHCYIEGTVDFIFGWATAWFEDCTINSKLKGGYITAASTPQDNPFGYVFHKCRLIAEDSTALVYLGRPWRIYASVTYLECEMGNHIRPEGWHNWDKTDAEHTTRYSEYKCFGLGASTSNRVKWAHLLTDTEASTINVITVLGGNEGWKPSPINQPAP